MHNDDAPLLDRPEDHPQTEAASFGDVRVMLMDSARYCDERNQGDVVIAASYCGALPARLMAPHRPRGVIGHDVGIAADGAGISGLPYLEALGIPAAAVDGPTARLGEAQDMWERGRISRTNVLAERCGVERGMTVADAAEMLATGDPGDATPKTKVRREEKVRDGEHAIVVTDSIVFAVPEDTANVLVTAGHTGKTGAVFIEAVSPRGFVCADGGSAADGSGTSGLAALQESGLAGCCYDINTAAMGDAFDAWDRGRVSAANGLALDVGVRPGQTVQEAARHLLRGTPPGGGGAAGAPADHAGSGSAVLRQGDVAAISPKFAEGLARVREVTDRDGALPAGVKAVCMAAAAAVKGQHAQVRREVARAAALGVSWDEIHGAALAVLISRGEAIFEYLRDAIADIFPGPRPTAPDERPEFEASAQGACDYFVTYFGSVPDYVQMMADNAPRALEGYFLMREWALAENPFGAKHTELLLVTVNAAEFATRFVGIHVGGARRAGASEAEVTEAVVCAIPVAGVASWLPGAEGVIHGPDGRPLHVDGPTTPDADQD